MITIERQGDNECVLAVIAALTNRTLTEVREVAQAKFIHILLGGKCV